MQYTNKAAAAAAADKEADEYATEAQALLDSGGFSAYYSPVTASPRIPPFAKQPSSMHPCSQPQAVRRKLVYEAQSESASHV